jgi:hypothetical protein
MARLKNNGQTRLARRIFGLFDGWREVSKVVWGDFSLHHRGPTGIKVSNGTPGLVLVQVCEPARQQKICVYTTDCAATMKGVRTYAKQNGLAIV